MLSWAVTHWQFLDGELLAHGMDIEALTPSRLCNLSIVKLIDWARDDGALDKMHKAAVRHFEEVSHPVVTPAGQVEMPVPGLREMMPGVIRDDGTVDLG